MFQFPIGGSPVFIDFDEDFEIDRLGEEFFQSLASLGGDFLQRHTLMPDDDALLRVTLHIDDRIDVDMLLVFLEPLHTNLHTVRDLLVVVEQDFFAYDLGDEEAGGLIGELVLVEVGRALGQEFLGALRQDIGAELVFGGDRQDLGLRQEGVLAIDDLC